MALAMMLSISSSQLADTVMGVVVVMGVVMVVVVVMEVLIFWIYF
jgi:hypothetical protein